MLTYALEQQMSLWKFFTKRNRMQAFRFEVVSGKRSMHVVSEKTSNNADKTHKYTNCASPGAVPFDHEEDGEARSE